jgi:hypothetical protein
VCDSSVSLEGLDVEILFRTPMKDGYRRLDLLAVPDMVAWIGMTKIFGLCISWATHSSQSDLHRSTVTQDTRAPSKCR